VAQGAVDSDAVFGVVYAGWAVFFVDPLKNVIAQHASERYTGSSRSGLAAAIRRDHASDNDHTRSDDHGGNREIEKTRNCGFSSQPGCGRGIVRTASLGANLPVAH
jgi:hypothetical protein